MEGRRDSRFKLSSRAAMEFTPREGAEWGSGWDWVTL